MSQSILIELACNDENGNLEQLTAIHFDECQVEGIELPIEIVEFEHGLLTLSFDDKQFSLPYSNHVKWVGNVCWDLISCSPHQAVRLFNFVRGCDWKMSTGEFGFFDKFNDSEAGITVQDLQQFALI